jgi:Prealbumin-like fold domain
MSEPSRRYPWRLGVAFASLVLLIGVVLVNSAQAGPIAAASGFEDDDGNLAVNSTFDWNGFSPVTWTGTAPKQLGSKLVSGWQFDGATDAQATTSDDGFAGGTKQDKNCATVIGTKAPNKDDLKRIYIAHKTVNNHIYLELAWVRIPQNTTSASAHVAFEFNQGSTSCATGGLVSRVAGDMLIVYDFAGSTTDNPILTLRRWVTSGPCEISSDTAPCWGPASNLTASGFAEAKVNTTATALDTVAPSSETLGLNEFGEAGIDLTAAGIFTSGACNSFGQAEGVSRSSGNSGTAAMEDLVGPVHVTISNCGSLLIHKTDGTNGLAGATFTATPGQTDTNGNTATSSTFIDEAPDHVGYYCLDNMKIGQSTLVHESAAPPGYNPDASDQTITVTNTASCATRLAATPITADGTDFVDTLQVGAIKITKTGKDKSCIAAGNPVGCSAASTRLLDGAVFQLKTGSTVNYTSAATSAGVTCIDGVTPGSYTLHESTAPNGYAAASDTPVTILANTSCSGTGAHAPLAVPVTDQPLTTITVSTTPVVTGTTTSTVQCTPTAATGDTSAVATPHTTNAVVPGQYVCTVVIDP